MSAEHLVLVDSGKFRMTLLPREDDELAQHFLRDGILDQVGSLGREREHG